MVKRPEEKSLLKITEADFQQQVIDLAHFHGWKVAHFRPAKTEKGWRTAVAADGKGFPDLVLVHPGKKKIIYAELKGQPSSPISIDQEEWLIALYNAGAEAHIWRPADFELIARTLEGKE